MNNVYNVTTSILTEKNVTLSVNVLAENLADAISTASYLKYNDKEIRAQITGAKCLATNVYQGYWAAEDLNPNYKSESQEEVEHEN